LEIADRLTKKKIALKILNLGINTATATGQLLFTMIGAIAEFEGQLMLERQREGDCCSESGRQVQGASADRAPPGSADPRAGGSRYAQA